MAMDAVAIAKCLPNSMRMKIVAHRHHRQFSGAHDQQAWSVSSTPAPGQKVPVPHWVL